MVIEYHLGVGPGKVGQRCRPASQETCQGQRRPAVGRELPEARLYR